MLHTFLRDFFKGTCIVLYIGGRNGNSSKIGLEEVSPIAVTQQHGNNNDNIAKHDNRDDIIKRFALVNPEDRKFDKDWAQGLNICQDLR